MCRTQLHPYPRLSFGYHREEEPDHIDAFLQQIGSKILSKHCIIEHDWDNRMVSGFDIKTGSCHLLTEITGIEFQFVTQFSGTAQHIQDGNGCAYNAWGDGIGEQVRPAALA